MTEIKLTKRYPQSRTEDITDAFMRGFMEGRKVASDEIRKCNSAIESLKAEVKGSERSLKGKTEPQTERSE